MARDRQTYGINSRKQVIFSEPRKILVGTYLTAKGERLLAEGILSKKEIDAKYRKNRYVKNPNAKPIKIIMHKQKHYSA